MPAPPTQAGAPPQPSGPTSCSTLPFPVDEDPTVVLNPAAGAKAANVFRRFPRPPPDGGPPVGVGTPFRTPRAPILPDPSPMGEDGERWGTLGAAGYLTPKGGGLYCLGSPYGEGEGQGQPFTWGRAAPMSPG